MARIHLGEHVVKKEKRDGRCSKYGRKRGAYIPNEEKGEREKVVAAFLEGKKKVLYYYRPQGGGGKCGSRM